METSTPEKHNMTNPDVFTWRGFIAVAIFFFIPIIFCFWLGYQSGFKAGVLEIEKTKLMNIVKQVGNTFPMDCSHEGALEVTPFGVMSCDKTKKWKAFKCDINGQVHRDDFGVIIECQDGEWVKK